MRYANKILYKKYNANALCSYLNFKLQLYLSAFRIVTIGIFSNYFTKIN